ncbi:hypothetical protein ALC56_03858 [Trachymyrmex septentrionalis]|uniref:Uncharacterized protein n=1 Tax=Trachymyrmex septentrionalis TaxID=34720 RepID=A0A195FLZ0_9HYME|nr:hypothetical protein ALC56_03858 [Trachymyrmex septentrionalis]
MRRDKLLGMYRDRELNLRARVGPIFALEKKKRAKPERQCANIEERQAENDQPYRQTVGRLILPGVHPPATLSIRPRGMRSIPSRVINNIWRLVFLRERSGRCYGGGDARRSVPKGSRTVNWVGESPDYIPCKHETNRDTFDDRTNDSVAITDAGCRTDEGFEDRGAVERSRNRGDNCCGRRPSVWPRRDIFPFIAHKSNNAIPYDTHADTEVRQNDTNA